MSASSVEILARLAVVEAERQRRAADPALGARVLALKAYQQQRFSRTYADLLRSVRYGAAARFFLDELYGPSDFSRRDAQFARIVPGMSRLFPQAIVDAVATLADLHALSETLDTTMATQVPQEQLAAADYVRAWQGTGRAADRERQVAMILDLAARLDRLTRMPFLRRALHMMRGPARAAGLPELQRFLENGFDIFQAMKGATEFIAIIGSRERALAAALFAVPAGRDGAGSAAPGALADLP
jgi:hypothetical protein